MTFAERESVSHGNLLAASAASSTDTAHCWPFEVASSPISGRGCFARKAFVATEIICKFAGPRMSYKDMLEMYARQHKDPARSYDNAFQIGPDDYLDLYEPYSVFNHSCEPNAGIRNEGVLFALRDIAMGEEITFDYSTTAIDLLWRMECQCRAMSCRHFVGDFLSLSHERREFFRNHRTLSEHVIRTFY